MFDTKDAKKRIELFVNLLEISLKNCNVKIKVDYKNEKLIIEDIETGISKKIELKKLNSII